jgi:serine/threonine protein kinase
MATKREQWEHIRRLGSGGQGEVFLVRRPDRATARQRALNQIRSALQRDVNLFNALSDNLLSDMYLCGRPDELDEVAALKEFKIDSEDQEQAINRLKAEIKALSNIQHPSILKYIDSSVDERFLVTQYYPGGSLLKKPTAFKGDPLRALRAFSSLVEAVKLIHENGAIHRDIKPENIFLSESGNLVLGDFGIVIFRDHDRLTATYERAGTRYWMAPWVDRKERIELAKVDATLDIYPLGKLLWFMIAGRDIFSREEYDEPEYNLEKLFPDQEITMRSINAILEKCVVSKRTQCMASADDLLAEVRLLEKTFSRGNYRPPNAESWPCQSCGVGEYKRAQSAPPNSGSTLFVQAYHQTSGIPNSHFPAYVCDHCSHIQLFLK